MNLVPQVVSIKVVIMHSGSPMRPASIMRLTMTTLEGQRHIISYTKLFTLK